MTPTPSLADTGVRQSLASLDWSTIAADLDTVGCATFGPVVTPDQCAALIAGYDDSARYRKHTIMEQHGYGRGEYKYFADPLPPLVADLRESLYPPLAQIANRWNEALSIDVRYPADHAAFKARCHAAGQTKPTPLILKYGPGDFNCLHQDVYGQHVFPLQVVFLLADPARDFTGGDFVLTEQTAPGQSRAEVVSLRQGHGVVFPVTQRPLPNPDGTSRPVEMRHGVSRVRTGQRFTLGIIFHDAK